jgi:DNA primase
MQCWLGAVRCAAYLRQGGEELAVRIRIALSGDRFRWKPGGKPYLYGLNRIADARATGHVVLVEGESDVHTLWHYGIPAIGLPGATNWREDRDAKCFDGIDTIYIVIEPDKGGQSVRKWLAQSAIRSRAKLLQLPAKDPSAMHIADPVAFKEAWQVALLGAIPWTAMEANERAAERVKAWELCADLAKTKTSSRNLIRHSRQSDLSVSGASPSLSIWLSHLGYWSVRSQSWLRDHHLAANHSPSIRC